MDEDIVAINNNTRNEKIKNFFVKNKKRLIFIISLIVLLIFGYFIYGDLKERNKIELADRYNKITINYIEGKNINIKSELIKIIEEKDQTYSPLALYFMIDNNIEVEIDKINELFDIVINKTGLEKEIKNLVIYKKALFNSDFETENVLIQMLKPLTNSNSVWKSHAFYLLAEYFHFRNEKQKAKDFFQQIISLENSNQNIKTEAQKRLNRDYSD